MSTHFSDFVNVYSPTKWSGTPWAPHPWAASEQLQALHADEVVQSSLSTGDPGENEDFLIEG